MKPTVFGVEDLPLSELGYVIQDNSRFSGLEHAFPAHKSSFDHPDPPTVGFCFLVTPQSSEASTFAPDHRQQNGSGTDSSDSETVQVSPHRFMGAFKGF